MAFVVTKLNNQTHPQPVSVAPAMRDCFLLHCTVNRCGCDGQQKYRISSIKGHRYYIILMCQRAAATIRGRLQFEGSYYYFSSMRACTLDKNYYVIVHHGLSRVHVCMHTILY